MGKSGFELKAIVFLILFIGAIFTFFVTTLGSNNKNKSDPFLNVTTKATSSEYVSTINNSANFESTRY